MIRSFRWNRGKARISMTNMPEGTYAVYAYNWEETEPVTAQNAIHHSPEHPSQIRLPIVQR